MDGETANRQLYAYVKALLARRGREHTRQETVMANAILLAMSHLFPKG